MANDILEQLILRVNSAEARLAELERADRAATDTSATANTVTLRDGSGNINAVGLTATGSIAGPSTAAANGLYAMDVSSSTSFVLANNTSVALTPNNSFSGFVFVHEVNANGIIGMFIAGGGTTTLVAESLAGYYSNTSGTASRANLYYTAGPNYALTIENKQGASRTFRVMAFRSRAGA